jgi:predicted membrane GTPase involved in stress response
MQEELPNDHQRCGHDAWNIAIMVHDGKTTVDAMVIQSVVFLENEPHVERVMDSDELER